MFVRRVYLGDAGEFAGGNSKSGLQVNGCVGEGLAGAVIFHYDSVGTVLNRRGIAHKVNAKICCDNTT